MKHIKFLTTLIISYFVLISIAQATIQPKTHYWYFNNVKESGSVLIWGSPSVEEVKNGIWTCSYVGAGKLNNIESMGSGEVLILDTFGCEAPKCLEYVNAPAFVKPIFQSTEAPWKLWLYSSLEHQLEISGIELEVGCKGTYSQKIYGNITGKIESSNGIGSPAFYWPNGAQLTEADRITGKLKLMGYEANEMIGVK